MRILDVPSLASHLVIVGIELIDILNGFRCQFGGISLRMCVCTRMWFGAVYTDDVL